MIKFVAFLFFLVFLAFAVALCTRLWVLGYDNWSLLVAMVTPMWISIPLIVADKMEY